MVGIVVLATVVGLAIVWASNVDAATHWAATGGVLTGAAVLLGLVGFPLALWQLDAVRAEQGRTADEEQRVADRLAQRADVLAALREDMTAGWDLRQRLFDQGLAEAVIRDYRRWVDGASAHIQTGTDEVEIKAFADAGSGLPPPDEIRAKVNHIRDNLIPKVVAGYWDTPHGPIVLPP